jgi:multidrug efflux pump subunit AcrA (membrane-fusion protein)
VKLDLPPAEKLRAGQFGRVSVPVRERPAVLVAEGAVVRRGQIESVFVVEEGVARLRLVKTGRRHNGLVEIISGLSGGEKVASQDAHLLNDGAAVEVAP